MVWQLLSNSNDRYAYTLAAVPSVSSLRPSSDTTVGGTFITILGSGFTGAVAVSFGTVTITDFAVTSDGMITVTDPPEVAGQVHVTVTTYAGTSLSTTMDLFTYTPGPLPTLTSLSPNSGNAGGGNTVTITGTGFTAATTVLFDTMPANFVVNSDTSITATVPAHVRGTINVTVSTYAGTSAPRSYTYNPALPTVTAVTPATGSSAGGTVVTVVGSNFSGATAVLFGGTPAATFTVISDSAILVTAPPGTAGTVDIQVVTYVASTTSAADQFTYSAAPIPTVTMISLGSGSTGGGNQVVITGTNLDGVSQVFFGSLAAASFIINSSTQITAAAPPQAAGTYDLTVQAAGGTSALSSADRYTYVTAAAPVVTVVSPGSGSAAGGTSVTVTGSGFTGASGVFFGGIPALSFTVNSDTSITAVSPPQAQGTVDITVQTPSGSSAVSSHDLFQYTAAQAPQINDSGISPSAGPAAGGTVVYISGMHLTAASAVMFGTTAAVFTVLSDTLISATAPAGTGTVAVQVTTPGGTATSPASFMYSAGSAPTLSLITPGVVNVPVGVPVVLIGSGFTGATSVTFGSIAASFTVNSDNSITAIVPAQQASSVPVRVTTPSGSSGTISFSYILPSVPYVTQVSTPASGTTAGGTVVVISGQYFTGATQVLFGSFSATSFVVNSDTQITAAVPPGGPIPSSGSLMVDITITTAGGTSATSTADQFTYTAAAAPTVTSVAPVSGPATGGTVVLVAGTSFTGATGVTFGGVAATAFAVLADGWLLAISPAQPAGTVDVQVTTFSATSTTSTQDQFTYLDATQPTLTSSLNPSVVGQSVTFTATVQAVTGSGIPTGTVTFLDGTTVLQANVPLNAAGQASFSTTALSPGQHFITVQYSGDSRFAPSVSVIYVQQVNPSSGPLGTPPGRRGSWEDHAALAAPVGRFLPSTVVASLSIDDGPIHTANFNPGEAAANVGATVVFTAVSTAFLADAPALVLIEPDLEPMFRWGVDLPNGEAASPLVGVPVAITGPAAWDTSITDRGSLSDGTAIRTTKARRPVRGAGTSGEDLGDLFFAALGRRAAHLPDWVGSEGDW